MELYASLAMYSRVHQDISKRNRYIGHVQGRTTESCGGTQCMGVRVLDMSPFFSLLRSLFSILPFYHDNIVASLLWFIFFSILFFHRSRFTLIPRVSLILLFHTCIVPSDRVLMHSR